MRELEKHDKDSINKNIDEILLSAMLVNSISKLKKKGSNITPKKKKRKKRKI